MIHFLILLDLVFRVLYCIQRKQIFQTCLLLIPWAIITVLDCDLFAFLPLHTSTSGRTGKGLWAGEDQGRNQLLKWQIGIMIDPNTHGGLPGNCECWRTHKCANKKVSPTRAKSEISNMSSFSQSATSKLTSSSDFFHLPWPSA